MLRYTVGVRSLTGRPADARRRGRRGGEGRCRGLHHLHVPAQEHGRGGGGPGGAHPQDASAYLGSDVYRLSASAFRHGLDRAPQERARHREVRRDRPGAGLHREGRGCGRHGLGHPQRDVGERSVEVESVNCAFGAGDTVGGAVPATLALTMGTPALRRVHAGSRKDYFATTTANVSPPPVTRP